jgi:hypothetical protein
MPRGKLRTPTPALIERQLQRGDREVRTREVHQRAMKIRRGQGAEAAVRSLERAGVERNEAEAAVAHMAWLDRRAGLRQGRQSLLLLGAVVLALLLLRASGATWLGTSWSGGEGTAWNWLIVIAVVILLVRLIDGFRKLR